jgi:hypothetical protein
MPYQLSVHDSTAPVSGVCEVTSPFWSRVVSTACWPGALSGCPVRYFAKGGPCGSHRSRRTTKTPTINSNRRKLLTRI